MKITIEFDTNDLSEQDKAFIALLADSEGTAPAAPAKAAKPAPAKPAEPAEPAPAKPAEPEPEEVEEDLLGGAPTKLDAVKAATELVSNGQQATVKEALTAAGVKRVSELAVGDIPAFLAAIGA